MAFVYEDYDVTHYTVLPEDASAIQLVLHFVIFIIYIFFFTD